MFEHVLGTLSAVPDKLCSKSSSVDTEKCGEQVLKENLGRQTGRKSRSKDCKIGPESSKIEPEAAVTTRTLKGALQGAEKGATG